MSDVARYFDDVPRTRCNRVSPSLRLPRGDSPQSAHQQHTVFTERMLPIPPRHRARSGPQQGHTPLQSNKMQRRNTAIAEPPREQQAVAEERRAASDPLQSSRWTASTRRSGDDQGKVRLRLCAVVEPEARSARATQLTRHTFGNHCFLCAN